MLKPYINKRVVVEKETTKPVFYEGREISKIDYTDTDANRNFVAITFRGDTEAHWIQSHQIPSFKCERLKKQD